MSDRRDFLRAAGLGAAALASAPAALYADRPPHAAPGAATSEPEVWERARAETWDVSWTSRITGKHKAMFDVPQIEGGVGIFRAGLWGRQYTEVLKLSPGDLTTVIVIRHAAIPLAMNSEYWATYAVGKGLKMKDQSGRKWAMANPMLSTGGTDAGGRS